MTVLAFHSINDDGRPRDYPVEATTPTTPRPPEASPARSNPTANLPPDTQEFAPGTPTRHSFGGIDGQRALPTMSFNNLDQTQQQSPHHPRPGLISRESSHRSVQSAESQDIDMDESDDGEGGSDGESVDGETGRPSKKKKGQRFFCTDFPPCNLSFTRSEHLARHIRKHTGERPFQCHCARRFSRLDNLRQHAQTVHVNEEIPGDSLAATGTRFQRQIRTDRVRPPHNRSRASTASSQGSHARGHSRNLSTSSIGSTTSTINRDDVRRRPPPLIMANDSAVQTRLTIDAMRSQPSTPPTQYGYPLDSPSGMSTPISSTYTNGQNSPGYGSGLTSPISAVHYNGSIWGGGAAGRRLSVPASGNPFQSPHRGSYPLSPIAPSNSSHVSSNSSLYGSPTNSNFSFSRPDSSLSAEAEWRRRTWHPTTYTNYSRPATSGLSYYQTPDAPRPAFAPHAATAMSQPQRLPGIETFDQLSHRPITPQNCASSPMHVDPPTRPVVLPGPSEQRNTGSFDRRGHASWDMSLHQNLNKLDIANGISRPDARSWGQQTVHEIQDAAAMPQSQAHQTGSGAADPHPSNTQYQRYAGSGNPHPRTPNRLKRQGWYNGPLSTTENVPARHGISPEDSSSSDGIPTPSTSAMEYHPSIVHSNGYVETHHPGSAVNGNGNQHTPAPVPNWPLPSKARVAYAGQHTMPKDTDISGLEALVAVAVATGEEPAPAAQHS